MSGLTPFDPPSPVAWAAGALVLAVLALAPGWALDRLLGRDDRPPFLAAWLHRVGLSVAWVSWSGLGLAQLGLFDVRALAALALVPALAALVRRRKLEPAASAPPGVSDLVLVVLLGAVGVTMLWPPFEDVLGGRDNGVYVVSGARLARHGEIRFVDPLVRDLPAEHRDLFFHPGRPGRRGVPPRLAGFYLEDGERGRVAPQFMPVPSLWIAIVTALLGIGPALGVTLAFALVALAWIHRTGEEIDGPWVGAGAAAVVGFCVLEAWFGRSHLSEIPDQALSFAALASAMAFGRGGGRAYAVATAASLTLTLVTRIDALLVALPLAVALGVSALIRPGRRGEGWLAATALTLGMWCITTWATTAHAYVVEVFGKNLPDQPRHWGLGPRLAIVGALALGVGLVAFRRWVGPKLERALRAAAALGPVWAVALVWLALYAWLVRADLTRGTQALAMRKLADYLGAPVLAAAIAGAALLLAAPARPGRALFLAAALPITLLYVQHSRNRIDQFWEMRRFISVPVPALALAASFAWVALVRGLAVRGRGVGVVGASLAIAGAGISLAGLWRGAAVVRGHTEDRGALSALRDACEAVPPDALVVADSRYESPTAYLTAPLAYLCDRDVLELLPGEKPANRIATALESLAATRSVYLATVGESPVFTDRLTPTWQRSIDYRGPWMVSTLWWPPDTVDERAFAVDLFRIDPGAPRALTALEMDPAESAWFDGFHAPEVQPETTIRYRWTRDHARAYLPGYDTRHPQRIYLRLASQRLRGDADVPVRISLAGDAPTQVNVGHGFQLYEIAPRATAGPPVLEIRADAMAGRVSAGEADRRDLGVSVDWIAWDVPEKLDMANPRSDRALAGFFPPEGGRRGERRFRWTSEKASMYLPTCPPGPVEVRIEIAADRSDEVAAPALDARGTPREIRLRIAGETFGPYAVPSGWQRMSVAIPAGLRVPGDATVPRIDVLSDVERVGGPGARRVGVRIAVIDTAPLAAPVPEVTVRFQPSP